MREVVLIDDDNDVREVVEIIVSDVTSNIMSFESAREAINYIKDNSKKVGLIISDYVMPEINGLDLYQEVRFTGIPFILLSGATPESAREYLSEENFMLEKKPFDEKDFIKKIQSCL